MKKIVLLFCFIATAVFAAEPILVSSKDGRQFLLRSDGTWVEQSRSSNAGNPISTHNGLAQAKGKKDKYSVYYDEKYWRVKNADQNPADLNFSTKDGDGYGMTIFERIEIPIENLKEIALKNAKEAAPDAEIVAESEALVDGKKMMCLQIRGTTQGIKFMYLGYYYSGPAGTLQFITYTSQNLFDEYKPHFLRLLEGIYIPDEKKG